MWIKRILKEGDASWKAYPNAILNKLLGKHSFKCNPNTTKNPNITEFYWAIIKNWFEMQEDQIN